MHPDKKTAELEEIKELGREEMFEQENILEIETDEEEEKSSIEKDIESDEVLEKKKRREVVFEMALFLMLGILLGITIKTESVKRITIGFNDYQIVKPAESYDIDALKKSLDEQIIEQEEIQNQTGPEAEIQE